MPLMNRIIFDLQAFRNGFENLQIFRQRRGGPSPWILTCVPRLLGKSNLDVQLDVLTEYGIVILELNILRNQPQPNWPQLIKVIIDSRYISRRRLEKKKKKK